MSTAFVEKKGFIAVIFFLTGGMLNQEEGITNKYVVVIYLSHLLEIA